MNLIDRVRSMFRPSKPPQWRVAWLPVKPRDRKPRELVREGIQSEDVRRKAREYDCSWLKRST